MLIKYFGLLCNSRLLTMGRPNVHQPPLAQASCSAPQSRRRASNLTPTKLLFRSSKWQLPFFSPLQLLTTGTCVSSISSFSFSKKLYFLSISTQLLYGLSVGVYYPSYILWVLVNSFTVQSSLLDSSFIKALAFWQLGSVELREERPRNEIALMPKLVFGSNRAWVWHYA